VCNKNQRNAHFLYYCFNLIMSSTCFEHPSVHPQEELYMQFYVFLSCTNISSLVDGRMCWIRVSNTSFHLSRCLMYYRMLCPVLFAVC